MSRDEIRIFNSMMNMGELRENYNSAAHDIMERYRMTAEEVAQVVVNTVTKAYAKGKDSDYVWLLLPDELADFEFRRRINAEGLNAI